MKLKLSVVALLLVAATPALAKTPLEWLKEQDPAKVQEIKDNYKIDPEKFVENMDVDVDWVEKRVDDFKAKDDGKAAEALKAKLKTAKDLNEMVEMVRAEDTELVNKVMDQKISDSKTLGDTVKTFGDVDINKVEERVDHWKATHTEEDLEALKAKLKDAKSLAEIKNILAAEDEELAKELFSQLDKVEGAVDAMAAVQLAGRTHLSTLHHRLGELRLNSNVGPAWARVYGSSISRVDSADRPFAQNSWGVQAGYDWNGYFYDRAVTYGVFADLATAKTTFFQGSGSVKSWRIGAYGSVLMHNGIYIDAVASYGRDNGTFDATTHKGTAFKEEMSADSKTLSLEVGKEFGLDAENLWSATPYGRLTYNHQGGLTLAAVGYDIPSEYMHNLTARLGALVSYKVQDYTIFADLAYEAEAKAMLSPKKVNKALSGEKFSSKDAVDHWADITIGAQGRLTDQLTGTFEVGTTFGAKEYKTDWHVSAGLRYEF